MIALDFVDHFVLGAQPCAKVDGLYLLAMLTPTFSDCNKCNEDLAQSVIFHWSPVCITI